MTRKATEKKQSKQQQQTDAARQIALLYIASDSEYRCYSTEEEGSKHQQDHVTAAIMKVKKKACILHMTGIASDTTREIIKVTSGLQGALQG